MNNMELNNYTQKTITTFFTEILELENQEAQDNATIIKESMSKNALTKLTHFFDYIIQCTNKDSNNSHCQNRNSECSNSIGCSSCCGNCNKD
ncbi:MAG: hypothetical protein E7Z87_01205 [Cyanobacteria bacterium SIG26]|nr:hypothetical protein [Cyanobacteria bacterium SIG26]MBQ7126863.1 hypothetical protein [bacterium]